MCFQCFCKSNDLKLVDDVIRIIIRNKFVSISTLTFFLTGIIKSFCYRFVSFLKNRQFILFLFYRWYWRIILLPLEKRPGGVGKWNE